MIGTVPRYLTMITAALFALMAESHAQGTLMSEPGAAGTGAGTSFGIASAGDDQWSGDMGALNIDGPIFETAAAPNGDLYIGGSFTTVGGVQANRVARWDGSSWHALGTGVPAGTVYAIAFNGNDVYIGGNFKGAGDVKASNIARWDGSAWSALGDITTEGVDSTVLAIAVRDGALMVGGNFTYSGNQDLMNFIARYTPSSSAFQAIVDGDRTGMDGGVGALLYTPNGNLYVGGTFTKAGTVSASRIARWSGTAWSGLGAGVGAQPGNMAPSVRSLAFRDSIVIAAGTFTFAGGKPTKYVARWSVAGNAWGGLAGAGINGSDSDIYKVAVAPSGAVYIVGNFSGAGGVSAKHIAYWTTPSSGWFSLGSGLDAAGYAVVGIGSKIWVGGAFTQAGGKPSHYLAQWSEAAAGGVAEDAAMDATLKLDGMRWRDGVADISFSSKRGGRATVEIADMRGQVVARPLTGAIEAGTHTVSWGAEGLAAGLYLCRVQCAGVTRVAKIVLAR